MFPNDRIITVGPRFTQAAAGMGITSYPDVAAASSLAADLKPGTWVYLKGSNSIGLAKLMPA
jgi:UDP-N-acetylmuramyl pentapeptide synthase